MLKRVFIWLSIFILLFANIPISFAIEKENLNDNSTETENTVIQQQIEENIDEEKEILSNENIENEKNTGTIEGKSENELIDESQSEINNVKMEATKQEKSISTKIEEKSTIISNGIYQIASAINDRMVLNVENANISSGTNINLYDNQNARNQKFKITYLENGYYKIEAMHSGKVLDVSGGKTSNGTNVQQWESNNTDAQKWIIKDVGNGYYSIISKCNGLYLDVQSGIAKNGSNIQTYEGNGTAAQKFKLKEISISNLGKTIENGIYQIVSSLDNNKVIKVNGAYDNNGANIQLSENYNNINQKFKITYLENGYYKIEAMHSGKVLDVSGGKTSNGTNVQQWESNNTDAQKWIIKDAGNGYYSIISKCNDLYLDVQSGIAKNGSNIQMYEGNGTSAQKFRFLEIIEEKVEKTIENGIYQIASSTDNNKVIKVNGAYDNNGANVQLSENYNNINQKFKITYLENGYYKIEAMHSEKVLDVSGGNISNGTNVQQWESNNTDAQKWIIKDVGDGCYNVISKCNSLYMDIASGKIENGTNIQMYEGNRTSAQKFKFVKVIEEKAEKTIENGIYQIVSSLDNNKVVSTEATVRTGANVFLDKNYNKNNQKFEIKYLENGYYSIKVINSEKMLDVASANIYNGTNIQQWDDNDTNAQKWIIKDAGDGCYNVISKCNSLYMDIASGKIENGTNIQMYEGNGTSAQKFKFVETKISKEIYNGIDVSAYNGEINWSRVSKTQDFAIIRVGYRGYLRPRIVMDTKFLQNIQGAQAQKMECGIYFFSQAINEEEAIEEANWVADMISGYKISYPVVLDSEWSNSSHNGRADTITKEERTKAAKAFLDTIKSRGYIPMLYASPDWIKNYLDMSELNSYDLWLAHYTWSIDKPSNYSGPYSIWQYTSKGSIDGILTDVDRNVCYKQY